MADGRSTRSMRAWSVDQPGPIAGRPLREPVVSQGPFIMNTEEQIASAIERYRAGAMGRLERAE